MFEFSRRQMLQSVSCGFGYLAFAGLATQAAAKEDFENPLAPKAPHFAAKAKRVILLCMQGGPSHVDLFDERPELAKHEGKSPGEAAGLNGQKGRKLMPSPFAFQARGKSGLRMSELWSNLAEHADDLCLINSAYTDVPNHPQAIIQLHTGNFQFVRPSMGAWVLYGLGTDNSDLPGFVTMKPLDRLGGAQNYGSSFLPAVYQGTRIGGAGESAKTVRFGNIKNEELDEPLQRKQIDLVQAMNRRVAERQSTNSEVEGIIESYELAFRMQSAVPKLLDINGETQATFKKYGIGEGTTDDFGRQCLMARRFAEAGVRFIELTHQGWDQHSNLKSRLTANTRATDQPIAALISDLKERDMLKDTLVIWSGEFGRTPAVRNEDGRDHNATGFSMWMCGGGVKGGYKHGSTDEFGIAAVEDKFHIHDMHATALHLLGLDHTKLTYRYSGRDFRLTDVHGNVAEKIIA